METRGFGEKREVEKRKRRKWIESCEYCRGDREIGGEICERDGSD